MTIRKLALPLLVVAACLAQEPWQSATNLPGIDWHGLTGPRKQAALKMLREENCACGCSMKVAECRTKDPSCGISLKIANFVVKEFSEGKNEAQVRTDLKKAITEPPVLEDPVQISLTGDPVRGAANARVTVVEFSDFQCPYCAKAVGEVQQVLKQFPNDVRLVFKQFPLDSHSQAELGAEASLAAQAQGKFWEMHDKMYAGFPNLDRGLIEKYARQIGLNMKQFDADLSSHKYRARVLMEEQEGEKAGVEGTPTFYLNGKKYNGLFEAKLIAPLVQKELNR